MKEVDEHVRKIYPEIPYSGDVAQPVNNFLYPWGKEMVSAENSITIDKNEGFSEKTTPQNTPPQQPPSMEPRSALRFV